MVILIDDAHKLSKEVLEEIDLLGNSESQQGKLLQVVLAGQPELDTKLDSMRLRSLRQRIALRPTPFAAQCNRDSKLHSSASKAGRSLRHEPLLRNHRTGDLEEHLRHTTSY